MLRQSCSQPAPPLSNGESQEIQLQSSTQSNCILKNERGSWRALAPSTTTVKRSSSRLNINCNSAYGPSFTEERASLEPWFLGNILIGGLVGVIVDPLTGAMFKYDDVINVASRQPTAPARTPTTPAAQAPYQQQRGTTMPTYRTAPQSAPQTQTPAAGGYYYQNSAPQNTAPRPRIMPIPQRY